MKEVDVDEVLNEDAKNEHDIDLVIEDVEVSDKGDEIEDVCGDDVVLVVDFDDHAEVDVDVVDAC